MDFDPLAEPRLISDKTLESGAQGKGKRLGERWQQDARLGVPAHKECCTMQGDNRLASSGGAGDAGRAVVIALDEAPLGRVKKDDPFCPMGNPGRAPVPRWCA